ncbi:hypothetical protein BOTBODRAFT_117647 [Botryobasidium botryosum FD-172 SS1]|uniref:GRIP domain-containing protein n=1 Tax=Botryobasidium botryosum (strain FD-172 SS1) TaxID=930990 RepID=A0A067M006_BOTB1|nr:hypothetical protein BOTBODRAFT_117647 [Botryobasidium botryosum FD-172 SS1]
MASQNNPAGDGNSSAVDAANETLAHLRLSIDSPAPSNPNGNVNGSNGNDAHSYFPRDDAGGPSRLQVLEEELERTKEEKESLATQYRNLLAKLTTMRTTLGNKLKQDAEELDRREQLVQSLTAQNEDLESTVETLKSELIMSNSEAERASREIEAMRSRVLEDSAQEAVGREREIHELRAELERCRVERDESERALLEERLAAEEARTSLQALEGELEALREENARCADELERERENSINLQSVLEDFQAGKEVELQNAVGEYDAQIRQLTHSLVEFKQRAFQAEAELDSSQTNNKRVLDLEKEVKEKNLLIGKVRHEAVILNEHLTEALRRLRKSSSDTNVDRRLVTNILLQFLNTPRADAKRFEMLTLLASILSWSDAEREKAGLQRSGSGGLTPSFTPTPSTRKVSSSKGSENGKLEDTETFSQMWVEFLLKEANQGTTSMLMSPTDTFSSPAPSNASLPGSPLSRTPSNSSLYPSQRFPTYNLSTTSGSPTLLVPQQSPPRKGAGS